MRWQSELALTLQDDPVRMAALQTVQSLDMPDCWIGAGFIRDAVWDRLHDRAPMLPQGDVDVLRYDEEDAGEASDRLIEGRLRQMHPSLDWSVKNQARMHRRNGDGRYRSIGDAMRFWPETATAVAVRLDRALGLVVSAPYGLDDLFGLRLVPTPRFVEAKRDVFVQRMTEKRWLRRYPMLSLCWPDDSDSGGGSARSGASQAG